MGTYDVVFRALDEASVRYVVVGGTAVVLQGHARLTVDLDLVVDLSREQLSAAVRALTDIGLLPRLPVDPYAFADPDAPGRWIRERNLLVFSMFDPASARREVDLFATEPVPFDELHAAASTLRIGGVDVKVASRRHLIAMKRPPADRATSTTSRPWRPSMTSDPWAEATFEGLERAQRLRVAAWSPLERLAWLDDTLAELDGLGLLASWRERRQSEVLAAWQAGPVDAQGDRAGPPAASPGPLPRDHRR